MAELTYRDAVARGIAQEMTRGPDVVFLGEDVAKAGGVFKTTVGLLEQFARRSGANVRFNREAREKFLAAQAADPANPYFRNNLELLEETWRKGKVAR